jgi:putative cardiolipin synthase
VCVFAAAHGEQRSRRRRRHLLSTTSRRRWFSNGYQALASCAGLPRVGLGPPSSALPASPHSALAQIVARSTPDPELSGFRLMPGGAFALDTACSLCGAPSARSTCSTYHVENHETGRHLLRLLRDAAQRGVRVRLLIDDLYTARTDELLLGLTAHPNVEVRLFNPFTVGRARLSTRWLGVLFDFARANRRMHNKLMIADGAIAVAGGRNIGDRYFRRTAGENFIDLDTFAVDAIVPRLAELFDSYWKSPYVFPVQSVASSAQPREA